MSEYDAPIDTPAENDLHKLAMQIRYDLTSAQGKLTELMRQIGFLEIENRSTANINGPGHYVPRQLRFLTQAEAIWNQQVWSEQADNEYLEREAQVRIFLQGFTDDEAEIDAHLEALTA